jgi:hypothetical protein
MSEGQTFFDIRLEDGEASYFVVTVATHANMIRGGIRNPDD